MMITKDVAKCPAHSKQLINYLSLLLLPESKKN